MKQGMFTVNMSSRTQQSADARSLIGQRPRSKCLQPAPHSDAGVTWGVGFTLAEVLITLGIIGIVATLTMPALLANYRQKTFETSHTVFQSRLYEALRRMNVADDFYHNSTESFVAALQKYLKIIKVCLPDALEGCFSNEIANHDNSQTVQMKDLSTSYALNRDDWGTDVRGIVLQNGYSAILAYNPNCQPKDIAAKGDALVQCLAVVYDVNGKKHPNKSGGDTDLGMLGANPFRFIIS